MLAGALRASAITGLALALLATPVLGGDTDGDLLWDAFEKRWGVTDYRDPDSDGDGVVDSAEDLDNDRLGNLGEQRSGTNPSTWDTDGDRKSDGREDADRDGRSNASEQDQRRIPPGMAPALRDATSDRQPDRKRCQAGHRVTTVKSCTFGDPNSDTTVVVLGDSHMTMLLTPYKQLAQSRGWNLVTMTKAACPAFLGLHGGLQYKIDKGRTCRVWRRNVIKKLNAQPPDYVIYQHVNYKLLTVTGKVIPEAKRPDAWKKAILKTSKQLPAKTEVLVLGFVPWNKVNPVHCLRQHPRDMSKCVTARVPAAKRTLDNALRRGAVLSGARYATLYDQICTYDPCPVTQGKVLVWRDAAHLTERFARKLTPSIARVLDDKLFGSGN